MQKIYILIIALSAATSVSAAGFGSRTGMDTSVIKADSLSDEQERLEKICNTIKDSIKIMETKRSSLQKKIDKEHIVDLRGEIERLRGEISKEEAKEVNLKAELEEISKELEAVTSKKKEIDSEEDGIVTEFIGRNRSSIDISFSRMNLATLSKIKEEGERYSDNDKMRDFLKNVNRCENNKGKYDEMVKTLNSPYDKSRVDEVLSVAEAMREMSYEQQVEVDDAKTLLRKFPDGLKTFGEFLRNLNATREKTERSGEYFVWQDYKDEEKYIITVELKERIDNFLLPVPYLRDKYNAFMEEFQSAPAEHSSIEKEILDLCETIGDN